MISPPSTSGFETAPSARAANPAAAGAGTALLRPALISRWPLTTNIAEPTNAIHQRLSNHANGMGADFPPAGGADRRDMWGLLAMFRRSICRGSPIAGFSGAGGPQS